MEEEFTEEDLPAFMKFVEVRLDVGVAEVYINQAARLQKKLEAR